MKLFSRNIRFKNKTHHNELRRIINLNFNIKHNLFQVTLSVLFALLLLPVKAQTSEDYQRYNYFFLEAVRQQGMGNFGAAFDLLTHARSINPNAPEVYYQLAGYFVAMKNNKEARRCYEKAAQLAPENSTYLEKVGQYYLSQSEFDKALETYERLYETNKAREDVLQILYQLYGQKNNHKKMIETLDRLALLVGNNEQISLTKMQLYEQMGNKRKEQAELMSLVEKNPLDLNYRVMLGNWLFQNKKKKEAFKEYQNVLKEEPDNAYAKLSLLDYYRDAKNNKMVDEIIETLLKSKKTEKETKMALLRQVVVENQENKNKDSIEVLKLFDRVLALPQEDADITLMKAAYLIMNNKPKAEIHQLYEQALAIEPDNARARLQYLGDLWESQDYDKVIALAQPAHEYNPEEMGFYYYEAFARYLKHDNDGALATFKKGVTLINKDSDPNMVSDFYAVMGDIYHEKGMEAESFIAYDSCLQWKPDNYGALNNYAYHLSVAKKDLAKAEQMSYKTIKAEPENTNFLDTYAWILFLQERYEEAKIYIEQMLKYDKKPSAVVLEHAGDIYFLTGDKDKALEYWTKAVEAGRKSDTLKQKIELKKYIAE
ncbi:tetratricopeptide repeat protein [Prevotella ihumii]|uniref:tetratricopeptide repeat protein n=1 Tax=Prevotella ihumii TaxID=1917878 RepID=UPI0009FCD57B